MILSCFFFESNMSFLKASALYICRRPLISDLNLLLVPRSPSSRAQVSTLPTMRRGPLRIPKIAKRSPFVCNLKNVDSCAMLQSCCTSWNIQGEWCLGLGNHNESPGAKLKRNQSRNTLVDLRQFSTSCGITRPFESVFD